MQLINKETRYAKSLGQDDAARVILALLQERSGFSFNGEIYIWDKCWIKYPFENLNEDIRLILGNKWSLSKAKFIRESVLHNSQATPNHSDEKIPFADGFYDWKKDRFIKDPGFLRQNRILNYLDFAYDEKAECPNFQRILNEIFPDHDLGFLKRKSYLQFFAYSLVPLNYHKSLILVGEGANGKSTLLDINKMLFPNHANIELQDFGDQNAILKLQGAAMVYSHEGEFTKWAMSNFKKIAEGKPLLVNKKYVDKFEIRITCKMMIATNHFPPIAKLDTALKRRMVVINMNESFVGREDFNLIKTIETEKAGIFNLVMSELPEFIRSNGDFAYNYLEDVHLKGALWVLMTHVQTLRENSPYSEMTFSHFYDGYEQNCFSQNQTPIGKSKVSSLIEEMDLGVKRFNSAKNVVKVRISS